MWNANGLIMKSWYNEMVIWWIVDILKKEKGEMWNCEMMKCWIANDEIVKWCNGEMVKWWSCERGEMYNGKYKLLSVKFEKWNENCKIWNVN